MGDRLGEKNQNEGWRSNSDWRLQVEALLIIGSRQMLELCPGCTNHDGVNGALRM